MNAPREIRRTVIDHPAAWTSRSLGGKDSLIYRLTEQHLAAIDVVLARSAHLKPQQVTREQFDHPALNPMLDEVQSIVLKGRGAAVIQGMTRARYSDEAFERICWGFGTHWGRAAVQSSSGDRLGHVANDPNNPHRRGYRDNTELFMHTDGYEILGLLCVQQGASGGVSGLVSTLAIHNEIVATRPELLDPLYRGFPHALIEARNTANPITPYNVPVFSSVNGDVSCLYTRLFLREAVQVLGTPMPDDLTEAIAYFEQLATRDDIRLTFMLEPGEMMVVNNWTTMHARTDFTDSATHTRHLLRLWLHVPEERRRAVIPEMYTWGNVYDRLLKEAMKNREVVTVD